MDPIKIYTVAPNGRARIIPESSVEEFKPEAVATWEFDFADNATGVLVEHEIRASANATAAGLYAPDGSYDELAVYAHKALTIMALIGKNWTDSKAKATPRTVLTKLGKLLLEGDTITDEAIAALKKE